MRQLKVKYDGQCANCGKDLDIGMDAMYEKSMGIFCIGCEPKDVEEIRHYRELKAQRKADRLNHKANRLDKEAENKMAEFNRCRKDWAWVTQPGHIPGRKKALDRYDKGLEMLREADEARKKAASIMHYKTIVKGDAERRREAKRIQQDIIIKKGSRVHDFCFGDGEVIGVYKKSYRIKFDRGFTYARDKTYVRPLAAERKVS